MMIIGKPYIKTEGNYSKLCSKVTFDGKTEELYYEVEAKNEKYLCHERADSFLVALLPLASAFGHDIKVEAPISERIFYQLTNILIPSISKFSGYYKSIKIECSLDSTNYHIAEGVGTGFSAGVDSFYTVLSNLNKRTENFNITHLTFFNVGACGSYGGEAAEKRFHKRLSLFRSFAENNNLELVTVNSNISEFIMMSYNFTHSFRSMSAVLALQKLFKVYYYSSDFDLSLFSFNPYDSSNYDLLNMQCFAPEGCIFYTSGAQNNRIEKVAYISEFSETYNLLNVCNTNDENCKDCEKCVRTMGNLYAIKKLDLYKNVFDIEDFKRNLPKRIGYIIAKKLDGTTESAYFQEIIDEMRRQKVHIPFTSYIYAIPLAIKFIGINTARRNKWLKKWWHKRMSKEMGTRYNDLDA